MPLTGFAPPIQAQGQDISDFGNWKRADQIAYLNSTYGNVEDRARANGTSGAYSSPKFREHNIANSDWMSPEERNLWGQVNRDGGTWLGNALGQAAPYALGAGLLAAGYSALPSAGAASGAGLAGGGGASGLVAAAPAGGAAGAAAAGGAGAATGLGVFGGGGAAGMAGVGAGNAGALAASGGIAGGAGAVGGGLLGNVGKYAGMASGLLGGGEQQGGGNTVMVAPQQDHGRQALVLAQLKRANRLQELRRKIHRTPEETQELNDLSKPGLLG